MFIIYVASIITRYVSLICFSVQLSALGSDLRHTVLHDLQAEIMVSVRGRVMVSCLMEILTVNQLCLVLDQGMWSAVVDQHLVERCTELKTVKSYSASPLC